MAINIHEHKKDITIPLIIHYYLLRAFRTLHKSFHTTYNVWFSVSKYLVSRAAKLCASF